MSEGSYTTIVITRRIMPTVPDAMVVRTDVPMTQLTMMLTFDQQTKLAVDLAAYLRDKYPSFVPNGLADIRVTHTVDEAQYSKDVNAIMRWLEEWQIKN